MKQRLKESAVVAAVAEAQRKPPPLLPTFSDVEKRELEEEGFKVCVRSGSYFLHAPSLMYSCLRDRTYSRKQYWFVFAGGGEKSEQEGGGGGGDYPVSPEMHRGGYSSYECAQD